MILNCLIIDDEPLARKGLREYIAEVDFLQLAGEAEHPLKALPLLQSTPVQLLFLDIQMPRLSGLDFLKTLQVRPMVILTTAFSEYALQGYELNVLDYLLKPISFERFLQAVMKAKAQYEAQAGEPLPEHFFIKCDNRLEKIFYRDLLFVEAAQNYVILHTKDKKQIAYITFKAVEGYLPAGQYMKVHKSFIVSIAHIDRIAGNEIYIGPHRIPISRNMKEEVMERLLKGRYWRR